MQRVMKVYFLGTQPLPEHIESSTRKKNGDGVQQCGY